MSTELEGWSRTEREALAIAGDPVLQKMLADERIEGQDVDLTLLLKLFRYVKPHRLIGALSVVLSLVESILMTLPAYIIGLALDLALNVGEPGSREPMLLDAPLKALADMVGPWVTAEPATQLIVGFGAVALAAWVVRWFIAVTTGYLMQILGQKVVHDLRVDVFTHITSMGIDYFHKNPVGRLVNRTTFDVQAISELFSDAFAQGMRDVTFIVVLVVTMFSLDATLAGILVSTFPVLIVIAILYRKLARPSMRTMSAVQSRMNSWLAENLSGMRENQLYRMEDQRTAEWHALTEAHQMSVRRVIQAWGLLRPGMMITTAVATAAILLVGYDRVIEGIVTVGVLLTFLQYTARIWVPVRNLTEKVNLIQTALTAGERVFDVLETPTSMADLPDADSNLRVTQGEVTFEDVHFTYPNTQDEVLSGIDLNAKAGQMLALIGDTGAGKSTIVSLISRFYDVSQGSVRIDNHDVRTFTLHNLRRGIALVPQDVVIFAGTIRENITLGIPATDEDILAAIDDVSATDIVTRFEAGLDHELEEGGRTLSGGERQLLSFARALLRNPPILILDEATASIDTRTEVRIQRALERLTQGRTTIVIAHRLSTIRHADVILVLRHGEVIERGDHASLYAAAGEYRRLYDQHISG